MRRFFAQESRSVADAACVLVGLILVTASLLKLRSLAIIIIGPVQDVLTQAWSALSGVLVVAEFATGAVLVLTTVSRRLCDFCIVLFLLFASYNAWNGFEGESLCGCFGIVASTPWASLCVDGVCVVLLVIARRSLPQVPVLELLSNASFRRAVALSPVCVCCSLVVMMFCENSVIVARLRGQPLRVSSPQLTVADREDGGRRRTTLWITNCRDSPICILGGTSKCSCSIVRDLPLMLEPRETRAIQAVFRPPSGTGWFEIPFVLYHDVERVAPIQGRIVVRVN